MKHKIIKCAKRFLAYTLTGSFLLASLSTALPVSAATVSSVETVETYAQSHESTVAGSRANMPESKFETVPEQESETDTKKVAETESNSATEGESIETESSSVGSSGSSTKEPGTTQASESESESESETETETETKPKTESETSAELNGSTLTLKAEHDGTKVSISGKKSDLNGAAKASIYELSYAEADEYLDMVLSDENDQLLSIYDISLLDENGNEVEPDGNVTVSLSSQTIKSVSARSQKITVVHISDMAFYRSIDDATSSFEAEYATDDSIEFETDSFSKFALVLTGHDSQKELNLSNKKYMEIDKYLSDPTGTMNGQNTYNTYLEHAYYDGTQPHQTINLAPASQDIILVLDQSASMAEERINTVNKSVNTFLKNLMNLNKSRMEAAKAGEYTDIDPDGDIEAQMKGHLMQVTGVVGYNNRTYDKFHDSNGKVILTEEDVAAVTNAAHIKNDYREYYENGRTDTDIQDCTRTDLALKKAQSWINPDNYQNTILVVLTDGAPYGYGPEGYVTYEYESSAYLMMSAQSSNDALGTARTMKNNGAHIYAVYLGYGDIKDLSNAFSTGDIRKVPCTPSSPSKHIASLFLSLMSSDYPENSGLGYSLRAQGDIPYPFDYTINFNSNPRNRFGKYIYLPEKIGDMVQDVSSISGRIDAAGSNNKRGYAGATSTAHDEVSDPFNIADATKIKVYKVPRIPANLGEDGIPTDADGDGIVTSFRWGDKNEWIDITSDPRISLSVKGNILEVTGFDYEENSVTDYDKDLYKPHIPNNAAVYKAGDYGYKLVVEIPIYSNISFGGNNIETNNSDTSAFFPSDPIGYQQDDPNAEDYLPFWKDNTSLNPEGNEYIAKYPVPHVDLKVNYKIPSDNLVIYAPQTAELANLVTDENNNLWYVDKQYSSFKTICDNAYDDMIYAYDAYATAQKAAKDAPEDQDKLKDVAKKLVAYEEAKTKYDTAQEALSSIETYIPDGVNNAFVDITYELRDPNGDVVGTLTIPHGKAYTLINGESNIQWSFKGGKNATATISGNYTISCTVTPVDTDRAPGGHTSTEADSKAVQESIPYPSTEYSPTGSTAAGSQTPLTITKNPTVHIFQLQISMIDSQLRKKQAIDFAQGNENLLKTENPHLADFKWVCTDGVTQSLPENEPGVNGSLQLGGGVTITCQIPESAIKNGMVDDIDGTTVTNVDDGQWIPVSVLLSRNTGNLNKSASDDDQVAQHLAYMKDDDNLYDGKSSVVWTHSCDYVTDCDDKDFSQAQSYSTPEDHTGRGSVRYLIHVLDNPLPDINKSTSTPDINKGEDILWNIKLSNKDNKTNPKHRSTTSTMVDILPYLNDGRIDPSTNNEGSKFKGDLYYKNITITMDESGTALESYKNGKAKLYYTTDKTVRTASESQILGNSKSGNIVWTETTGTLNGNTITDVKCPEDAVAIRMDTTLSWLEEMEFDLTANLKELSVQHVGDRYHNQAFVTNGNGIKDSEVVATTVTNLYIGGTIWEDSNGNDLMDNTEKKVSDIIVTLYKECSSSNNDPVDRTVSGKNLVQVYDMNGDKYPPVLTTEDGSFIFDDLLPGTYYVVADYVPKEYDLVKKQAGKDDPNTAKLDSEAEEEILTPSNEAEEKMANSVWIKEIVVTDKNVANQNIGLRSIKGTVKVGKTLNQIYFPSSMTEEERASYKVNFTFTLRNTKDGRSYTEALILDQNTLHDESGKPSVWVTFSNLPLGTYELTEVHTSQYTVSSVSSNSNSVVYDSGSGKITVPVTSNEYDFEIDVHNKLAKDPPGGDQNGVRNWLNMHVPVKLEVVYVGPDPISDKKVTQYTFSAADFDPDKGGDIVVTYDDGSSIKLSDGSLRFDQLTFSPSSVTSVSNSGDTTKDKTPVTVYYSEKGRTVTDNFSVAVDLKPLHKFRLNFDANGSTFDDGETKNSVMFGYDEETKSNFVTSGVYKDVKNGSLNSRGTGYTFAGWNTRDDGSGIQYSDLDALNAIGADTGISSLTLYANWKTNVTFDANGGTLDGGTTDDEKAVSGKASGKVPYNVNQTVATGLTGNRKNYTYVLWNTKPDGTGTNLDNYGKITGPVTFYAIYYQSEYYFTGTEQTFIAPVNGWYKVQLWGASGGYDAPTSGQGGKGAYVSGEVHVDAGTKLYVYVGAPGANSTTGTGAGYNGGANSGAEHGYSGSGGGATDIRIKSGNWTDGLSSRIAVAAGGGGGGATGHGGYGGALTGGNGQPGGSGGGQNSGGNKAKFGVGGTPSPDGGGGGGGWYGGGAGDGDTGGGGGSSYLSGFPGCAKSSTGYIFRNPQMIAGNQQMPAPNGGYETGHTGACRARIQLISVD